MERHAREEGFLRTSKEERKGREEKMNEGECELPDRSHFKKAKKIGRGAIEGRKREGGRGALVGRVLIRRRRGY